MLQFDHFVREELIKIGVNPRMAAELAPKMFTEFDRNIMKAYAESKWKEGCHLQRMNCENTAKIQQLDNSLELVNAIRFEIKNAPEPKFIA